MKKIIILLLFCNFMLFGEDVVVNRTVIGDKLVIVREYTKPMGMGELIYSLSVFLEENKEELLNTRDLLIEFNGRALYFDNESIVKYFSLGSKGKATILMDILSIK